MHELCSFERECERLGIDPEDHAEVLASSELLAWIEEFQHVFYVPTDVLSKLHKVQADTTPAWRVLYPHIELDETIEQ